jgi:hypothetical protein
MAQLLSKSLKVFAKAVTQKDNLLFKIHDEINKRDIEMKFLIELKNSIKENNVVKFTAVCADFDTKRKLTQEEVCSLLEIKMILLFSYQG